MKILTVLGARPQFIKAAPVSKALEGYFQEVIVHTGQHYDINMSEAFFKEMHIPLPVYNLGIGSGSHGFQTGNIIIGLEEIMLKEAPDLVLLYGDTNSTIAGAIAAVKLKIAIAHVEAGLRVFNLEIPEEVNRRVSDLVSRILFCPTQKAVENLKEEGIQNIVNQGKLVKTEDLNVQEFKGGPWAVNVGDVMYDAMKYFQERAANESNILTGLGLGKGSYMLVTVHRPMNTDNPEVLSNILTALGIVSLEMDVIFPMHPRTKKNLNKSGLMKRICSIAGLKILEPVGFLDMVTLEANAAVIATDSGGVQKEAAFHRVPCITLLERTPWEETIKSGWNRLVGNDPECIIKGFHQAVNITPDWTRVSEFYGDGTASQTIVACLRKFII